MRCPSCAAANRDIARYCGNCGTPLPRLCSVCHREIPDGARFCPTCASPALPGAVAARDSTGALLPGAMLEGRYRVERRLGRGGFGAVYLARDTKQGDRECAVKELVDKAPEAQRQFEREATLLADLRHPRLVRVTDYFQTDAGEMFLVMDYIPGRDLCEVLQDPPGFLPEDCVVRWGQQVCEALHYMHGWTDPKTGQAAPVIHRDVKPGNLKLLPDGSIIVIDLGIAKVKEPGRHTTRAAQAFSPPYSPLEQYGQGGTDERSDIYSLGVTLYELATGQVPPEATERTRVPTPRPRDLNKRISPALERVLLRAIEPKPDDRFQSVDRMSAALARLAGRSLPAAVPAAAMTARYAQAPAPAGTLPHVRPRTPGTGAGSAGWRQFAVWTALAAVVLLLGFGAYLLLKPGPPVAPTATPPAAAGPAPGGVSRATATAAPPPPGATSGPATPSPGHVPTRTRTPVASAAPTRTPVRTPARTPAAGGSPAADRVVAFSAGPGAQAQYGKPEALLGDPDARSGACCQGMLQLGRGGSVLLAFADNTAVDSSGPDLAVAGEAAGDDYLLVEVSADGQTWHAFPRALESSGPLDLAGVGLDRAVYVRLTDLQPGTATGAEVDAVAVYHSGPAPSGLPPLPDAVARTDLTLRGSPSGSAKAASEVAAGDSLDLLGRTSDNTWVQVQPGGGPAGWAPVGQVGLNRSLSGLAVASVPVPTARAAAPTVPPKPAGQWVQVADSTAEYFRPGSPQVQKWWYLYTKGRPNFRWNDMRWDPDDDCYYGPQETEMKICSDRVSPDPYGDTGILYKNAEGGTFRFEWDTRALNFYHVTHPIASQGPGAQLPYSVTLNDLIAWDLFFWVASAPTQYHIRVFRLAQP